MNYIIVNKLSDLQSILRQPIDRDFTSANDHTYPNMWALTLSDDLISTIQLTTLTNFFMKLLEHQRQQLHTIDQEPTATFYLWFDEQALQLRFNIIPGIQQTLPFGCNIRKVLSLDLVLQQFLTTAHKIAKTGEPIEFLDHDTDEYDDANYILDVYVFIIDQD